jgi:hypothetical protein
VSFFMVDASYADLRKAGQDFPHVRASTNEATWSVPTINDRIPAFSVPRTTRVVVGCQFKIVFENVEP